MLCTQVTHRERSHVVKGVDVATGEATLAAGVRQTDGTLMLGGAAPAVAPAAALELLRAERLQRVRVVRVPPGSDADLVEMLGVEGVLVGQDAEEAIFTVDGDPRIVAAGALGALNAVADAAAAAAAPA